MTPFTYCARGGSVVITTSADGDLGPVLTVGPEDLLTLLQVTLVAIEHGGGERAGAAREKLQRWLDCA